MDRYSRALAGLIGCLGSLLSTLAQPALEVTLVPNSLVELRWPTNSPGFQLEAAPELRPPVSWEAVTNATTIQATRFLVTLRPSTATRFFRLGVAVPRLPQVTGSSPSAGETGVAVTRETIFRLSAPLAPDVTIATDQLYAEFGGRRLLSRAEIAADRLSVTLFYLENLPAAARVASVFDTDGLKDASGRDFDGDDDGRSGGLKRVVFETSGVTGLPGTAVTGRVFASEPGPGGTNRPLVGVTITVDGAEETLRTTTDETGYFRLDPAPGGRFFVHVDGRTALGSRWPSGDYYPFVGKAWDAVPAKTNNLAGGSGEIFLPLVPANALTPVNPTAETRIGFLPGVAATNPALAEVVVRVPANALFSDNGTRGGRVGIAPVAPDRLPEPLPPGLNLPLVITIQTDGPLNFDRPVPVRFPNLPDPVTGRLTPPGAKTLLWSFNHDTGRWEPQGTATITADGKYAETDPGVGVRQPGWHGVAEGSPAEGPEPEPLRPENPDPDEPEEDPCAGQYGHFDCDGDGCAESSEECEDACKKLGDEVERVQPYCPINRAINNVVESAVCSLPVFSWATGCPDDAWISKFLECREQLANAKADYDICVSKRGGVATSRQGLARPAQAGALALLAEQRALTDAGALPYQLLFGSPAWTAIEPEDFPLAGDFFQLLGEAMAASSPGQRQITAGERTSLLAIPLPGNLTPALVQTAVDRLNADTSGTLPAAERQQIQSAVNARESLWNSYRARGWQTPFDGLLEFEQLNSATAAPLALNRFFPRRRLWYAIENPANSQVFRGQLDAQGQFSQVILPANTYLEVTYVDPITLAIGSAVFKSATAGEVTRIPAAAMLPTLTFPDADADGLADDVERVVGTRSQQADSDNDGATDLQELRAGLNPLDGQITSQGVVAALRTQGTPRDLAVTGNVAVIADGAAGVLLVDVTDPLRPLVLNRVNLSGATLMVAADGRLAAAALGTTGVAVIDIADPTRPRVLWQSRLVSGISTSITAVALRGNQLLAGTSNAELLVIDAETGRLSQRLDLPFGTSNNRTAQILIEGSVAYVVNDQPSDLLNVSQLVTLALDGNLVTPLGVGFVQRGSPPTGIGRRFHVGNGFAYLGYFGGFYAYDVRNPAAPTLLGRPPSNQQAVLAPLMDGAGRLLALTTSGSGLTADLSIYSIQNPTNTTGFIASFPVGRLAWAARMHRGYVLVADNAGTLQTLNVLPTDLGTNAPTLAPQLTELTSIPGAPRRFLVDAGAVDDILVRNVEVLVDGRRAAFDGSYPFQLTFALPLATPLQPMPVVQLRATDRGGNSRSQILDLTDRTAPALVRWSPGPDEYVSNRLPLNVEVSFNEPLAPESITPGALTISSSGPDNQHETADDVLVGTTSPVLTGDGRTLTITTVSTLPVRSYRITLGEGLADVAGNTRTRKLTWDFLGVSGEPRPTVVSPDNPWVNAQGSLPTIELVFDALLSPAEVARLTVQLFAAGPDANLGTADDLLIQPLQTSYDAPTRKLSVTPPPGQTSGKYRIRISSPMYGQNPYQKNFEFANVGNTWVAPSGGLWSVSANWSRGAVWPNDTLLIPAQLGGTTNDVDISLHTLRSGSPLVLLQDLALARDAEMTGRITWRAGMLSGGGVLNAMAGIDIESTPFANTAVVIDDLTLVNHGIARFRSGILRVQSANVRWQNLPGSRLDIDSGATRFDIAGPSGVRGRFENRGTISKAAGTTPFSFDALQVVNDGSVVVGTGSVVFPLYEGAGSVQVAAGARVVFQQISRIRNGSVIRGAGNIDFGDQTQTTIFRANAEVDADYQPTGLTRLIRGRLAFTRGLQLPNGRIETRSDGPEGLEFLGPVELGELLVDGSAGARFERSATLTKLIVAAGPVTGPGNLQVTDLEWANGSLLGSGLLEVSRNLVLRGSGGTLSERTLRLLPGATATVSGGASRSTGGRPGTFDVRGTLHVDTDQTLVLPAFLENAGTIELSGLLDLNPGAVNPPVGAFTMRPGGHLRLAGGQLRVGTNSTLLNAGEISGAGRIVRSGRGAGIVNNRGVLRLDQPGTPLQWVDHSLIQTETGEISAHIGPAGAGQTTLTGSGTRATLGGRLRLVLALGFNPAVGKEYILLTAPVVTGTFTTVEGTSLPGGRHLDVRYEPGRVRLVVVN